MDEQDIESEEQFEAKPKEGSEEPVDIYSRLAIRAFAIFFGTIFGGVLLMINLRNVGYKRASWQILAFSIAFSLIPGIMVNFIAFSTIRSFAILFNLIGGIVLADYFFPRYFPDNDYYPRPIWGALAISIIIVLGYLIVLYNTGAVGLIDPKLAK